MGFDAVKKIYKKLGVEIKVEEVETGSFIGMYQYFYNAFDEGWETTGPSGLCDNINDARFRVIEIASNLIEGKRLKI